MIPISEAIVKKYQDRGYTIWDGVSQPKVGDVTRGCSVGWKSAFVTWVVCSKCSKGWWVRTDRIRHSRIRHSVEQLLCESCVRAKVWADMSVEQRQEMLHKLSVARSKITKEQKRASCDVLLKKRGYSIWDGKTEPELGMVTRYRDIGKKGNNLLFWTACPECGFKRWVIRRCVDGLCMRCGAKVTAKKIRKPGARYLIRTGYIVVNLSLDSPYLSMAHKLAKANSYCIQEHRLIMARHIGRLLKSSEVVHHINGIRSDNRIENLELLPHADDHAVYTKMQQKVNRLKRRVIALEKRNNIIRINLAAREIINGR